jgi:murein DD-endopeptidase MepM/ murein hydrolase activator NlpD
MRRQVTATVLATLAIAAACPAQVTGGGAGSAPQSAMDALSAPAYAPVGNTIAPVRIKLPYPERYRFKVFQGIDGSFSHSGLNRYSWDFGLPEGTPVCAAAEGRVVRIKQDSLSGGTRPEDLRNGNVVIIDHGGGIFTQYLHLKANSVRVEESDMVRAGQVFALSGNTGFSSVPHLHFQVHDAGGQSLPAAFLDVPGDGVPRQDSAYESGNDGRGTSRYAGESPLPLDAFRQNGIALTRTDVPAQLLRADRVYRVAGRVDGTARRVAVFLMGPEGGKPRYTAYARVRADGSFNCEFSLGPLRARSGDWCDLRTQSNIFSMAVAPVRGDGTYWSSFSVPVSVR